MDPPLPLPMQSQHLSQHSSQGPPSTTSSQQRPTVSRNARACTVCRAVKMKCVGAEDGQQPCQRCKRSNLQCVFEKHRRGRKPGSKLSDTSKMMRRIDKAPSDNSTTNDSSLQPSPPQQQQHIAYQMQPHSPYDAQPHQSFRQDATAPVVAPAVLPGIHHLASTAAHLPPVSSYNTPGRLSPSRHFIRDAEPRPDVRMYDAPSAAHRERNNFFGTVLAPAPSHPSPEQPPEHPLSGPSSSAVDAVGPRSLPPHRTSVPSLPRYTAAAFADPISAGILTDADAANLFELILHRLNGFLMLFDPSLHTLHYIRERSPFLLTCLLTVACKFWRPEVHRECLDLVNAYVPLAFERGWRSTEVVQAFLFLTFYPEVGHDRTWAFIGYACRMAVDLGMHRVGGGFDAFDSGVPAAERRNRERTFLVLFVQERCWASLSGKQSMLPDSDLVRSANSWHADSARLGGPVVNDVMLCAIVELRRIATETYGFCKSRAPGGRLDVDTDVVLVSSNNKLTDWMELWHATLQRSGGQMFHFSVLCIYRLQARVFVNGLGIESVLASSRDNSQILTRCYTSGISALLIPSRELAPEKLLRYTHHLITAMIAHCAVFLLRALEIAMPSQELADRHEKTMESIAQTADAYEGEEGGNIDAAVFLRALLKSDVVGYKAGGGQNSLADSLHTPRYRDGHISGPPLGGGISRTPSPEPVVARGPPEPLRPVFRQHPGFEFPAGPDIPMHPSELAGDRSTVDYGSHAIKFWKTMFSQLGFGHPQAVPESG